MAAIPAWFYARNRTIFHPAPLETGRAGGPLSVLIPARDEAENIEACVRSVVAAADGVEIEVVVHDDASEDDTAAIVTRIARGDPRIRLVHGVGLPAGWNGKQHACQRLADAATHDTFLWIDADVRLEPHALGRMLAERDRTGADLLSGFPRQVTVTWLERLLLPLIHFVLLGFLSLRAMRRWTGLGFAAGCGQLFLTRRDAYEAAGGHAAIRASRHDGVTLPRAYRRHGMRTDLFDATDVARCRMYDGAAAVWAGLSKNATEGVASLPLLPIVTAMLLLGHVLPLPVAIVASMRGDTASLAMAFVAAFLSIAPRLDAAQRFHQPVDGALLHPFGVVLFLAIQWEALLRGLVGKQVAWRGRGAAESDPAAV